MRNEEDVGLRTAEQQESRRPTQASPTCQHSKSKETLNPGEKADTVALWTDL